MSRYSRLIPAVAVTILLAACGQDGGQNPIAPEGPSYDGGIAVIGGNRTDTTTTSSTTTNEGEAPADTTGRGGIAVIGGN